MAQLWNREDAPPDRSRPRDEFIRRLFPCWVMLSSVPFPQVTGPDSLQDAIKVASLKIRFTEVQRESVWTLPFGALGRYVRVQLEERNFLHFAQLQIFGTITNQPKVQLFKLKLQFRLPLFF